MKIGAVFSGGGAAGVCSVAMATKLGRSYDVIGGTSTGALECVLIAVQEYERLKTAYLAVNNKTVYSVNPFNRRGRVSVLNAAIRQILRKESLGESGKLRQLIDQYITQEDFDRMHAMGKYCIVAVQEIRHYPPTVEYKDSRSVSFENFKKWVWVSANAPMLMSVLNEGGRTYVDGGLTELLPIKPVLLSGVGEVDVFLHRRDLGTYDRGPLKDTVHTVSRCFSIMREHIEARNLAEGLALADQLGIKVNVYRLPAEITGDFMNFDRGLMEKWYDAAYNSI